jgi:precorrin-8X/cobalt-precorrin-8 methylmutase
MEWHITDAQSLSIIDQEIGEHSRSPAEYEIVRQLQPIEGKGSTRKVG